MSDRNTSGGPVYCCPETLVVNYIRITSRKWLTPCRDRSERIDIWHLMDTDRASKGNNA